MKRDSKVGMFNYVIYKGQEYQTKDFDCLLTKYKISDEGRLLEEEGGLELIPEEKRTSKFGFAEWIHKGWKDTNYHGMLNFYSYSGVKETSIEYLAKFTDGTLVEIKELK